MRADVCTTFPQGPCNLRWGVALGVVMATAMLAMVLALPLSMQAQQGHRPMDPPLASQPETPHHRIRLILKDGSYQTVLSYKIQGQVVHYRSAERDGAEEDIPLALVDLPATRAWEQAHDPDAPPAPAQAPVLSPELAREEALREARTPVVATLKDAILRLPEDDSVLVLDTYMGTPELVPLPQQGSDLNRETAHETLRKPLDPAAAPHDLFLLKDERADVQLHVAEPVFYVRLERKGTVADDKGGGGFTVDTGGASGRATPGGGSAASQYLLEQVDVRRGARAVESPLLRRLNAGQPQPGVIAMSAEAMPGGVWQKLTPAQPLEFGEYVLIEVLDERSINADTWDFGVHPTAKENDEAMRPEVKKPAQLERRRP